MAGLPAIRLPVGGVLALDLSSVTGWAYARPMIDRQPWCGTWHLPKIGGEGARYVAFENILAEAMTVLQPIAMVIEATLPMMALAEHSNQSIAFQQITLRGIAIMEAYRANCPWTSIDARTVRQEVLGAPWGLKRKEAKAMAINWCARRKIAVADDNAADAVMLWEWRRMRIAGTGPVSGPLFRETVH